MAKIIRKNQKVFGDSSGAVNNFGVFGSLAASSIAYSKDPDAIQSLPAFLIGWAGAVVGNKSPSFEDTNSLFLLAFRQLAYLFQAGIAEYNAETIYYIGSSCRVGEVEYISKTDDNVGNDPTTDTNNWRDKRSFNLEFQYPVGELYVTRRVGNPNSLLGFGTWNQYSDGRLPAFMSNVGVPPFNVIDSVGGGLAKTLLKENLPGLQLAPPDGSTGITATSTPGTKIIDNGTSPTPVDITPPYVVAWYAWLRVA